MSKTAVQNEGAGEPVRVIVFGVFLLMLCFASPDRFGARADRWPIESDTATGDWFGLRNDLADAGVTLDLTLIADWSHNLAGGLNTNGSAFRHLFDARLTVETERLIGLEGGTFVLDFYNHNGPDASADDVGDFQAFSNIDADRRTQIAELFYQHVFFDEQLRVIVGKVEANAEFAFVDYGGNFTHSSPGFSPTVFTLPTYPDPATAVILFVEPNDTPVYAGVGVFDGAFQEGVLTGSRGPSTFFGEPADLFVIGEAGVTWSLPGGLWGRLGAGGWGHTGTFERFDGSTYDGTAGLYVVFDQTLWRESPPEEEDEDDERDPGAQGIGLFFQYGYADPDVSEVDHHVGVGLQWVGALPTRDDDVLGVMASYVHFSHDARSAGAFDDDYELAVEMFYKAQVTPWLAVMPNLQVIVNPGGAADVDDAVVATLRVELVF